MFYTIGNKRFMSINSARAYAYRKVKKTGVSANLTRITAQGAAYAGVVLTKDNRVLFSPPNDKTYVLYSDGSIKE